MSTPNIRFRLPVEIKKDDDWYVGYCPVFDVYSQGKTKSQAKKNLGEALFLFLLSCFERGTIDEVLKECGFQAHELEEKSKARHPQHIDVSIPFGIRQDSVPCHA